MAIAIAGFVSWRAFADKPPKPQQWKDAPYILNFKKTRKCKDPKCTPASFQQLLDDNGAIYCVTHQKDQSGVQPTPLPGNDCPPTPVQTASVDDATRDLVLTCGGAHVTQAAGFTTIQGLVNVDNALYPPQRLLCAGFERFFLIQCICAANCSLSRRT
jgi:hypothetical protein